MRFRTEFRDRNRLPTASSADHRRLLRTPLAVLTAGAGLAMLATGAFAQGPKAKLSAVRIILETNATDCDTGLQLFFDGGPWTKVAIEGPDDSEVLDVSASGALAGFGLTEQFNESNEPVMAELVAGLPGNECDEPEFSLDELFGMFPEGHYEFEGLNVNGEELTGRADLSHVIPAAPELIAPDEGEVLDLAFPVIVEWAKVEEPIVPGLGRGPHDSVNIIGFHVVVEREDPAPKRVFNADLPADATEITVPAEFMTPGSSYKFEVLQIDESGNQTIAEREFETQ